MHTAHWLRNLRLSPSEINHLLTTCKEPTLSLELNDMFVKQYSTKKYYIEYNGFLSNHVSHGMIALWKLNCSPSVIHNFMDWYTSKKPLETPSAYEQKNESISLAAVQYEWKDLNLWIGSRTNFYGIYEMMQRDLRYTFNYRLESLIADRFPSFSNGIAGSLFHGLIHLGYGLSSMNKQIVLEGMSYTTHSYLYFDYKTPSDESRPHNKNSMDLLNVLELIRNEGKLKQCLYDNFHKIEHIKLGLGQQPLICLSQYGGDIINEYVSICVDTMPLMTVNSVDNHNIYLNQMYRLKKYLLSFVIKLYAYSGGLEYNDFVLLHAVTAAWSLTQIISYLKDVKDINQSCLQFIAASIATFVMQFEQDLEIGMNEAKLQNEHHKDKWRYLIAEVVYNLKRDAENNIFYDEHVYKLVAVILENMEYDIIDEELAYYAIRKAAEFPLKIRTVAHERRDWIQNIR